MISNKRKIKNKQAHGINLHDIAGNWAGDEGARALSDALKVNTTLTTLKLKCEQEEKGKTKQSHHQISTNKTGDFISEEGACALSEALKVNSTLTALDLASVHF